MPKRLRTSFCSTDGSSPSISTLPLVGRKQRREHFDCGRLARAIRTEEGKDLALLDFERDVLHRRGVAEALHQISHSDRRCHL